MRGSPDRYSRLARSFHWMTVVLVIVAWLLGIFGVYLPKGSVRNVGLTIHMFAGLAIVLLLVGRITLSLVDPAPKAASTEFGVWLGRWSDPASRIMQYLLYALLFAVPVCGIVLQFARGDPISLFGLIHISSPWIKDRVFAGSVKDIHELLAHLLVGLAALHSVAALLHHFVFHDRTLTRMLPPRKS